MNTDNIVLCGLEEAIASDYLFLRWELNKYCNLDCSYCELHSNKKDFRTLNELMHVVNFIDTFDREIMNVSITGGEPTTNPHFIEVIGRLVRNLNKYNKKQLSIFTNLTASIEYLSELWISSIKHFEGVFTMNCSFHGENTDFKLFKTKIEHCIALGYNITIRFMIDSNNLNELESQYSQFAELDCITIPEFVHDFDYRQDILIWYESLPIPTSDNRMIMIDEMKADGSINRTYISNDQINYYELYKCQGVYCSVGSKHLLINSECGVSLCYAYNKLVGCIFNILTTSQTEIEHILNLYTSPIRCINKECYCESWVPRHRKNHTYIDDTRNRT